LLACSKSILKSCGPAGFFRGCAVLVLRDSFSFGLYFLTYEALRRRAADAQLTDSKFLVNLVSGGCAGRSAVDT
jgi:hypothetical protein